MKLNLINRLNNENKLIIVNIFVHDQIIMLIINHIIVGVGSTYLSVFGQQRRTNNDQESYHRQLSLKVRQPHPNVWVFVGKHTRFVLYIFILVEAKLD